MDTDEFPVRKFFFDICQLCREDVLVIYGMDDDILVFAFNIADIPVRNPLNPFLRGEGKTWKLSFCQFHGCADTVQKFLLIKGLGQEI